jgi:hypothetical protein
LHSFILKENRPVLIQFENKKQALQISAKKFCALAGDNGKSSCGPISGQREPLR